MSKISFRFYKDHKVRAVWDEERNLWWFSVLGDKKDRGVSR